MYVMTLFCFFWALIGAPIEALEQTVVPTTQSEQSVKESDLAEGGEHFTFALLNMLVTLFFFLALIFALSWVLKRMNVNRQEQVNAVSLMKIVERRQLSTKAALHLVEVGGRLIAIGESPTGLTLIANLPRQSEEELQNGIE